MRAAAQASRYASDLAPKLGRSAKSLANYRGVSNDLDEFSKEITQLASETAEFAELQAELQSTAQSIAVDRENFDTLLLQQNIEPAGWFATKAAALRDAARQTSSETAYFDAAPG